MASIALFLATDAGSRCLRTFCRVASVLLAEWIFHFLYPGSSWCWVLYENGKKKRLFDFASWLVFVSLTNITYPKLIMSAQKLEATWTETAAGRNVLCLSKIFGLRIIWQVIGGLMISAGMTARHQLHHYVRSDVQLMLGHVAALAFLVATFWQGDLVVEGESNCSKTDDVNPDADFNDSDNDATRPRPFGYRPMFNVSGTSIQRGGSRPPAPFRLVRPTGASLQKPLNNRPLSRSPTPTMSAGSMGFSAPHKRSNSTLGRKRNSKSRTRYPTGVNNLNNSLVNQSPSKFNDLWSVWSGSMRSQKHAHHHDHQFYRGNANGTCGKNQCAKGISSNKNSETAKPDVGMWSNRSSCDNPWNHWAVHGFDPSMPGSSQHAHSRQLTHNPPRKRAATGHGCTSGYG